MKPQKIIYKIEEFPAIHYLHNALTKNYDVIFKYSENIINNKKVSQIKRIPGQWTGQKADDFVNGLDDTWIYGWTDQNTWFNYLMIYNNHIINNGDDMDNQIINDIFIPIKSIINICGLSLLMPEATIKPHIDENTTISKNRLAYHFNVFGNGSIININGILLKQKPKKSLVFDSGFIHSVTNGNEYRLLIYIDFNVLLSKNFIYGRITDLSNDKIIIKSYYKHDNGIYNINHYNYGQGLATVSQYTVSLMFNNQRDRKSVV